MTGEENKTTLFRHFLNVRCKVMRQIMVDSYMYVGSIDQDVTLCLSELKVVNSVCLLLFFQ